MIKDKNAKFQVLLSKLKSYIFLILAGLLLISVVRNVGKVLKMRKEVATERQRVEKMRLENEEIAKKVNEMNDSIFVEKEVRNKLGLIKPGEASVVLPDKETLEKLAPNLEDTEEELPPANWEKWLNLFK